MLYSDDQEPEAGFCPVCRRNRPNGPGTMRNFGCYETEADDEDRERFACPGNRRLECAGCGATCVPRRLRASM